MMKKTLITVLLATLAMVYVSCGKEDNPGANPDNGNGNNPQNEEPENLPSIIGTWNATSNACLKIMFYYQDGTICDSTEAPMDDRSFVFRDSTNVDTPWEIPCTYSLTSSTITFNLAGIVDRVYQLDDFTDSHLAFHRTDTSDYQTYENNDTIDVVGIEYEIWDLAR